MRIHELKYANTNTWLIEGKKGRLLFDTGWAGSFPVFCGCMGEAGIPVQKIDYILISHFHPDHMGIAQEIASHGAVILVMDVQQGFTHVPDGVFEKEGNRAFLPIEDDKVRVVTIRESREFLREIGIDGEILSTPGHTDDSISLWLDDGTLFVGDLNPLYERELHHGTQIEKSWQTLLSLKPVTIHYGHAATAHLDRTAAAPPQRDDLYELTRRIMKYIDKGVPLARIQKKTGADQQFVEDVTRMYLTHRDVGVQGILDRIEIKGR
ncbi:MAG: MBL fold metallo-hydrolase [Lachnospiraceae bacterium]|nr:MBL fold metallo-hydrolase [Lachnospiraceae bacterium]